jgi:FlaA1/EpsC-like NDP-sugar epimerase
MNFLLKHRRPLAEASHAALAAIALAAGFLLRFEFTLEVEYRVMLAAALPILVAVKLVIFRAFSLRDLAWRFVGFRDLLRLALANLVAACAATVVLRLIIGSAFPRSIHILDGVLCLMLMIAARAVARLIFDLRGDLVRQPQSSARTILIYGAGKAGVTLLSEIAANPQLGYRVAGFIDDSPNKRNQRIHGVRVLGTGRDLPELVKKHRVSQLLIALASASGGEIAAILEKCLAAGIPAKRIPALSERIDSRVLVDQIRDVRLEDLLGRSPVVLDESGIRARLAHRVVLVTGAGGSIGSELCRQIARFRPAALIGFDHAETALYQIDQEIRESFPDVNFIPEVGSIRDRRRLAEVFEQHQPQSVYHAAAYKHVPMMEAHLFEAVDNNVFGTQNVAVESVHAGVEDFVLISSDKAVRPANVMGATKRLAELVCLAQRPSGSTRFMAARFGNVLGSSGSVIPLFQRQIAAGGPVTVTHPEMRRFFMTIPEAAQLVLQAASLARGMEKSAGPTGSTGASGTSGEIFVLNMGEPVCIVDLARNLVLLSGLDPDRDIQIEFSGIRPGEKLFEELSAIEEDTVATRHAQIRVFSGRTLASAALEAGLDRLKRSLNLRDPAGVLRALQEIVPDYSPSSFVLRRAAPAIPIRERARSVVA